MGFVGLPNCCLKLTACGTLHARQNTPALARRGLTMRSADQHTWDSFKTGLARLGVRCHSGLSS